MFDEAEQLVKSRQPDYPPEQSMSGNNTYSRHCDLVGWRPGYCICLHKLNAYERDGSLKTYPECDSGIRSKECQALNMRDMERAAGKSLFYVDRSLLKEEMDKRFAESLQAIRKEYAGGSSRAPIKRVPVTTTVKVSTPVSVPTPVVKADVLDQNDGGYAAAINAAINEAQKPEPKVASPSPSAVKGRSLLDIVRSQMGK